VTSLIPKLPGNKVNVYVPWHPL